MSRANRALVIGLLAAFGLWGCAKGPAGNPADRIKSLEAKASKLEDDFRAAAAARDQFRQRLVAAEQNRDGLKKEISQLQLVVKERDDLRKQLQNRTSERDTVQTQFEAFRKQIKDLIGQADASTGNCQPVTEATTPALPKS